MMRWYLAVAASILGAAAAGCRPCSTASDCSNDELCRLGDCVPKEDPTPPPPGPRADAGSPADAGPPDSGTPDAGSTWQAREGLWPRFDTGTTARLYAVWGAANDEVWAVGEAGTILRFDGARWQATPSGTSVTLFDVHGAGGAVFAVGARGTLLKYDGQAWSRVGTATTTEPFRAIHAVSDDEAWLVGPRGTALHYAAGVIDEEPVVEQPILLDVAVTGRDEVWVVGTEGTLARRSAGAWTVLQHEGPRGRALRRVQATGGTVTVLQDEQNVLTWEDGRFDFAFGTSDFVVDLWAASDGAIYTAFANARVARRGADRVTTDFIGLRPDVRIEAACVLPSGAMWLVGAAGVTLRGPETIPQAADPISTPGRLPPVQADFGAQPVTAKEVALGEVVTCILRSDGQVACAGRVVDESGTLTLLPGVERAVDIAVAQTGVCALRDDRRTDCFVWANGGGPVRLERPYDFDQLYDGRYQICGRIPGIDNLDCFTPEGGPSLGPLGLPQGVARHVGDSGTRDRPADFACSIAHDGTVRCATNGSVWRAGVGYTTTTDVRRPQRLRYPVEARDVALGPEFACAAAPDGVWCWGGNRDGQLGDGTTDLRYEAARIPGLGPAVSVAATYNAACSAHEDGAVHCWGSNRNGELGDDSPPLGRADPGVVPGLDDAVELVGAGAHMCALRRGGKVSCWGFGEYGQLGDGGLTNRRRPVEIFP